MANQQPAAPVGPIARVRAYENAISIFDEIVHQNVATRQIFTHNHLRPDGTMLAVVVELPETYAQSLPAAEIDLTQVSSAELLEEVAHRLGLREDAGLLINVLDGYDDQEDSDGAG